MYIEYEINTDNYEILVQIKLDIFLLREAYATKYESSYI
jgi:hypothetical protein